jgi:hypothetical protein
MHSNMVTQWMGITCSLYQMHKAYICKQLHLFLQLADSNSKEIKSKTKEWNDRIKQDKVSKTDNVYCIIFCVHWFPLGLFLIFSWNIVDTNIYY